MQSPGSPPSSSEPTAPAATDMRRNDDTARGARANRDHIVERVKVLVDIVRLHHEVQELVSPWNEASEADDTRWRMVAGSLEGSTDEIIYPHHVGCRELFHNTISVPEDISRVSVSTIQAGQFWTQFGGPDGAYLEHLTGVSFYDSSRLVFEYDSNDIPAVHTSFGRAVKRNHQEKVHFDIDGPGGEPIISVTIRQIVQNNEEELGPTDGFFGSFEVCHCLFTRHIWIRFGIDILMRDYCTRFARTRGIAATFSWTIRITMRMTMRKAMRGDGTSKSWSS